MFLQFDRIETRAPDGATAALEVIWTSADRRLFAVRDIVTDDDGGPVETGWPVLLEIAEGEALVRSGAWEWSRGFTPALPDEQALKPEHRARRDANWAVIRDIAEHHVPAVFVKAERRKLVAAAAARHGVPERKVKRLLLRWLHRGMDRSALLPDWHECGAPGVPRIGLEGAAKPGPKPRTGHLPGVRITVEIRQAFLAAYALYCQNRKHTLDSAYHLCMQKFFSKEVEEIRAGVNRRVEIGDYARSGLPTYDQFRYHVHADLKRVEALRKRLGARVYEMKHRALLGSSSGEVWGPGARFQIDATVLDVYVRSRLDPNRVIGRPTLYVVIDVFSRMIVGIYIGLEHPSWTAAMMALANAASDKVAFCAGFGIEIEADEWPCATVASIILGDRGEMLAAAIEPMLLRFRCTIENAAPYRADWKGIVERRFGLLQANFAPYVHGYVEPDFRKRGGRDYRLDAVLDIDDVTTIVIRQILYYNNLHRLTGFRAHRGMVEDRVPPVPREMWNWGVAARGGALRVVDQAEFRFVLLPTDTASVTPFGIAYGGQFYTCEMAIEKHWFSKARQKRWKVTISYDKRYADEIYLHDPAAPKGFHVCRLTPACRANVGHAWLELLDADARDAASASQARNEQILGRAAMEAQNEATVEAAEQRLATTPDPDKIRDRVTGIRESAAMEREHDRKTESKEFLDGMREAPPQGPPAQPTDITTGRPAADPYAAPGVAGFNRRRKRV